MRGAALVLGWSMVLALAAPLRADILDGLCQMDPGGSSLPKATCYFPSCPHGNDCSPPTIDRETAAMTYKEPILQWKDTCPNTTYTGACWEVSVDFTYALKAADPSGVSDIGVHLVLDIANRRQFKKYWIQADRRDAQGRYELAGGLQTHVPPGGRLEMSVFELCARDKVKNESCILPRNPALGGLNLPH